MFKAALLKRSNKSFQQLGALLAVLVIAIVGTILIISSHAASPYTASSATSGTIVAPATKTTCAGTSGSNNCVAFNSASTGGGGGTSGGCTSGGVVAPCVGSATTGASGWGTPIFDDEFSGSSLDTSKWSTGWFGGGISGPVNGNEDDCYDPALMSVSGGYLNSQLETTGQAGINCPRGEGYATGYITSMTSGGGGNLFAFTYGFAEARIFLQNSSNSCSITASTCSGQVANWPSWWLQSDDDGGSTPPWTEIDILEGLGGTPEYHVHAQNGDTDCQGSGAGPGWHTFAVDWGPGTATFYYDGQPVGSTCNTGDLNASNTGAMRLILGEQTGYGDSPEEVAPSNMLVDYVRVWQQ